MPLLNPPVPDMAPKWVWKAPNLFPDNGMHMMDGQKQTDQFSQTPKE